MEQHISSAGVCCTYQPATAITVEMTRALVQVRGWCNHGVEVVAPLDGAHLAPLPSERGAQPSFKQGGGQVTHVVEPALHAKQPSPGPASRPFLA